MKPPIDWLLAGEPWIECAVRRDLLGQCEEDQDFLSARKRMLTDPKVRILADELSGWPGSVISSHKSASQPFHRLAFAADLGLKAGDFSMNGVVNGILDHQSSDGTFLLPMSISQSCGGSGREQWAWALCDAPLTTYSLVKLGLGNRPAVKTSINFLANLCQDNGWRCVVAKELGSFRGPGRKEDPCPFATLAMLKLLSQVNELRDGPECHHGTEALLSLWAESLTRHPYMFYMGTDFRKLKAPFIWYDLLHVLDVLSRFPWLCDDSRLKEMVSLLESKADTEGRFTPESVWTAWSGWEFGQKKVPSRWLTLLAWRILGRIGRDPLSTI
jgi:hypothetical protein